MKWAAPFVANVIGQSHLAERNQCQDAYCIRYSENGQWISVCVCDGAGSATKGGEGARIVANEFADRLMDIAIKLDSETPGAWINDAAINGILDIRAKLRLIAGKTEISDYHATLVAVLLGNSGGFAVHIGDGAIFGGRFSEDAGSSVLIDKDYFISAPENGEYVNETFFITEGDWIKHLRITPLPSLDWLALATDGGCAFSLTPHNNLNLSFIPSIFKSIVSKGKDAPPDIIVSEMCKERYADVTNDDKTLALIFDKKLYNSGAKKFALSASEQSSNKPEQRTVSPQSKYKGAVQGPQANPLEKPSQLWRQPKLSSLIFTLLMLGLSGLIGGFAGYAIKAVNAPPVIAKFPEHGSGSDAQEAFRVDCWSSSKQNERWVLPGREVLGEESACFDASR